MSTSQFHLFAAAVAAQFTQISAGELYRVDVEGDVLWQAYLASFPEGTNPIFRVRTEHDGSYDRNFVRQLGNVVRLNADGTVTSLWDVQGLPEPYQTVVNALSIQVRQAAVKGLFRTKELKYGYVRTFEKRENQDPIEWHHFHADIPAHLRVRSVGEACGEAETTVGVIRRGLEEIAPQAVTDVLDLIEQKALYRGDEFKPNLVKFRDMQRGYRTLRLEQDRSRAIWLHYRNGALRIRNTAIGTLLTELSEGMELEKAVGRFEAMVAPTNYKRPTALVTPRMVEDAVASIRSLGLESALTRRHATLADVSINNVLWADNAAQAHMKDGLTDLLMGAVKAQPIQEDQAQEISIEDFQARILASAVSMELFLAGNQQSNLMSLTAPADAEAGQLFKWNNGFAWSYNGNITDSIKEKVKAAGGNTGAILRVSLAWFNHDDLDLHAACPDGHVYYGSPVGDRGSYIHGNRRILDVDMNVSPTTRTPVENLSWVNPKNGVYTINVNAYTPRETSDVGFTLEVENAGKVTQFHYPKRVTGMLSTISFRIQDQKVSELKVLGKDITSQGIAQEVWGVTTERFVRVETVLNSPNHWDGQAVGNKHWFFILEGCKNPEPCRGIYNEFLKPELEAHRKVFEVLGNKTKVEPTNQQLSGVGFSSTKRDSVIVRVATANSNKTYKVNF